MPTAIVDYYQTVEKVMGGAKATEDFFRLFVIPGMNHCGGGTGAISIDYLTYLENWVEKKQPPDEMIGARVSDSYLASLPCRMGLAQMRRRNSGLRQQEGGCSFRLIRRYRSALRGPCIRFPFRKICDGRSKQGH